MKRRTWKLVGIIFIVGCVLVIAFIPRAIELLSGNFLFGFDQGNHWLAAKSIVVDHKLPLIGDPVGGRRGFFQAPGWFYLLSVFFFLWRGDPFGSIVLMVFAGLLTVGLAFVAFRKIFGTVEAVLISLLLAVSPAIIIQSRFAWPPFMIPPLMVLYLWMLFLSLGRPAYLFWVYAVCGVMAHVEMATALTLLLPTAILSVIIWRAEKFPLRYVLLSPLGFIPPLAPLILFDLRHNFLNAQGVLAMASPSGAAGVPLGLGAHWGTFAANAIGAYERLSGPGWLFILLQGAVLAWAVRDRSLAKQKRLFLVLLCLLPVLVYLVFTGYRDQMWEWWILELPVVYLILTGFCLGYLWRKHLLGKLFVAAFVLYLLVGYGERTAASYRRDYGDVGGTQKIQGKREAMEYIFHDASGTPFGLLVFTPPVYTYPYDYVAWWLGTSKYGYVPVSEKISPFYLLIEPDPVQPWSYKGWLETVVVSGTTVWQKTLPSGFIIEKRTP